jgi:hypothetical protein
MRSILLALLIACGGESAPPPDHSELDKQIEERWELIRQNKIEIDALLKNMDAVADRAAEIRKMVDCTVAALDSKMNDRDQVLTITECFRQAGYVR